jgi:hypothetical protein
MHILLSLETSFDLQAVATEIPHAPYKNRETLKTNATKKTTAQQNKWATVDRNTVGTMDTQSKHTIR